MGKCKIRLKKDELFKTIVCMSGLALLLLVYFYFVKDAVLIGDALFLSGLFFLCMGLFRVVRLLGLFDSLLYGMQKLTGKTKQSFYDYTEDHPYTASYWEMLLLGAGFMAISLLF